MADLETLTDLADQLAALSARVLALETSLAKCTRTSARLQLASLAANAAILGSFFGWLISGGAH